MPWKKIDGLAELAFRDFVVKERSDLFRKVANFNEEAILRPDPFGQLLQFNAETI